jgi:hypothetical protein
LSVRKTFIVIDVIATIISVVVRPSTSSAGVAIAKQAISTGITASSSWPMAITGRPAFRAAMPLP